MISNDSIDRLVDVPPEHYNDALSLLFISHGRLQRINTAGGREITVLIEVINDNPESRIAIKTAINKFERYAKRNTQLNTAHINSEKGNNVNTIFTHSAPNEILRQQFTLLDPSLKAGIIAIMLDNMLKKYEQQGKSFIVANAFNQLSNSDLKIIEPWEQASICHKCSNFEQIVASYPYRESKCSKCGRDNLTVRVYAVDKEFDSHKKNNKDLPLYIRNLINRSRKDAAVTSKNLSDFAIPNLDGDIDVYIEKTLTGIECKLRIFEFRATESQLRDYSIDIEKDLKKYIQAGVKNLIVITNLDKDDSSKLYDLLYQSIGAQCLLKVLHKSVPDLIQMVQIEIGKIIE